MRSAAAGKIKARRIALTWMAGGLTLAGLLHGHAYAESMLGIAAAALLTHRRLMATGGSRVRRMSGALGAVVGAIGVLFLAGTVVY